jgi:hypothetical protein
MELATVRRRVEPKIVTAERAPAGSTRPHANHPSMGALPTPRLVSTLPAKAAAAPAIATPIPVRPIGDNPDPIFTYWVPSAALLVSVLGALFAGLALKYIVKQIELANKQTAVANDALTLTKQSLDLAQRDYDATLKSLSLATQQAAQFTTERGLTPNLVASVNGEHHRLALVSGQPQTLRVFVENYGQRTAEDCTVEIYCPASWRNADDRVAGLDDKSRLLTRPVRIPGLAKEVRCASSRAGEWLPLSVEVFVFKVHVYADAGFHQIHWRIDSEGRKYEGYLRVEVPFAEIPAPRREMLTDGDGEEDAPS